MRRAVDAPFLLVVCGLVLFGLLIFTSAALGLLARDGASLGSVAVNQILLGFVSGSVLLVLLSRFDYRKIRPYTPYLFGAALLLTLLTFVPHIGLSLKGASRWLSLGPLSFQPAELLKCAAVLLLASIYAANFKKVGTWQLGLVPFLAVAGVCALLLLIQPDTASAMILCGACALMLFAAGGKVWHLGALLLLGIAVVGIAALVYPHVRGRIETYINHSADPQGSGYQVQQSLIAVGSGGFSGRGFGQSVEKFSYLPEPIGDSIFAVAGEEFGFLGSTLLVVLYLIFGILGLRIAARAPDPFGGLIVVGLVGIIVGQSFFNIASALGLVPLIGVPLIFVSHGGSALALSLAEVGVILSVSRRMRA